MALTLTSGGESRLDGAPDQLLPNYEDMLLAAATYLVSQDADGALYGGDVENAKSDAYVMVAQQEQARRQAEDAASQQRQAATAAAGVERNRMRAARQGVVPESLPMDEYGSVSARTVRDANLPLEEQEARQAQYDELASDEINAMREGRFHGAEAQARQFEQDYGLPTSRSKTGKTDLDYLREQQEHQGFLRTGRGEMIPMGPTPTPESIASRRDFDEWGNETPGSERQARYFPVEYEEHREGVREGIRNRAQWEELTFGTGPDRNVAPLQAQNRQARRAAEDRQAEAQREVTIARLARRAGVSREQARKMMDEGRAAARPPLPDGGEGPTVPLTAAERRVETQSLRDMAGSRRDAELEARRQARINQAMMAGGQPTGGPFGTRATTTAIKQLGPGWREIALLDRLTNGRVGGPTPLAVEGANAAAAAQMAQQAMVAFLRNNPGAQPGQEVAVAGAEAQLPVNVQADLERRRNNGVLPANSAAGMAVMDDIEDKYIGLGMAGNAAVDAAVEAAKRAGIPPEEAEMRYKHRRWAAGQGPGDAQGDRPPVGVPGGVGVGDMGQGFSG